MISPVLRRSLATAALTGATWSTLTMQTVHAEEKLSIYDDPEPKVVVVESPTKLEEHVAYAEKYANDTVSEAKSRVDNWVQQWNQWEAQTKSTLASTIAKDEDLIPNGLYVGVAALAGTILARNRNIVLRFLTSSALATGASYYFLPKTTHNICVHLERLERKYPELQSAHQSVNKSVDEARQQIEATWASLRGAVDKNTEALQQSWKQTSVQETGKDMIKDAFETTKKNVESMYSTRSNPGVEETLKSNKD